MSNYKAIITEIRALSPTVKLFEIDFGQQHFEFSPGQWVSLTLKNNFKNGAAQQKAAFSIVSAPNEKNTIEIAVKRVEALPTSKIIHDELKVGDEVEISHAQGDIVLPEAVTSPIFFIAGGTGITPFISMLRKIYQADRHFKATLIYSVTGDDECLFYDELFELQREYTNFRFVLTTTQQAAHHADFYGRINSDMLKRTGLDHVANFYLCGPPNMVDDIASLLAELGIAKQQIHYDKWW